MSLTTLSDDVTWNQTFNLSLWLQIQVTLSSTRVWAFIIPLDFVLVHHLPWRDCVFYFC